MLKITLSLELDKTSPGKPASKSGPPLLQVSGPFLCNSFYALLQSQNQDNKIFRIRNKHLCVFVLDEHCEWCQSLVMKTNETKLAERMRANGLKDRTLSERTGIERSIITKMRLGRIVPTLERAVLVCNHVAGLRPEDLVIQELKKESRK